MEEEIQDFIDKGNLEDIFWFYAFNDLKKDINFNELFDKQSNINQKNLIEYIFRITIPENENINKLFRVRQMYKELQIEELN
jgi:hypothetical protein